MARHPGTAGIGNELICKGRECILCLTRRAARYVERLLSGCDLSFGEGLGLTSVSRGGQDESCTHLSKGTQEQLAVLTRLAFADLLLEDGAPISLILDDPLVYSDDARLETMTDILLEASQRMQVILLTCRSKAFRHVEANRIYLVVREERVFAISRMSAGVVPLTTSSGVGVGRRGFQHEPRDEGTPKRGEPGD